MGGGGGKEEEFSLRPGRPTWALSKIQHTNRKRVGNVTQRESAFLAQVRPGVHRTGSEAAVHTEARADQNRN